MKKKMCLIYTTFLHQMLHNNTPNIQLQVNIFKLLIHIDFQLLNTLGRRDSEVMYKLNKQKKKRKVCSIF